MNFLESFGWGGLMHDYEQLIYIEHENREDVKDKVQMLPLRLQRSQIPLVYIKLYT